MIIDCWKTNKANENQGSSFKVQSIGCRYSRCMQQNQYGFEENTNQIEPEIQNLQGKMITRNTLINEPFEYVLKINHTKEEDDEEEACNTIGPS